jgi:glycosyltransferase involved in cell wall biosynthesis
MKNRINYSVITPVRNEAEYLPLTLKSMAAQTIQPSQWIIVNDGSSDATGEIAEKAARTHPWISVVNRPDRGFRQAGGGVIESFYQGYALTEGQPWQYLVKLDGDLSFAPDYFEKCFAYFEKNDRLGIAGGTISNLCNGAVVVEAKGDPKFHVRGATKIYRRPCWEEIGGLIRSPGWDTLDEVKANMLGWNTSTLSEIPVIHHRPAGAAYGAWNDRVKGGVGCYITGYHPLFMLLKSVKRMTQKPFLIGGCGFIFGYVKAYVTRAPRTGDKAVVKYFQAQQMRRLMFRKSLWG